MDERQVRLLVVLSAATLMVGLVYLLVPRRTPDPPWDAQATVPVWDLNPEQVTGLRVEQPERDVLDVSKQGQDWILRSPVEQPADPLRVQAALEALARLDLGVPVGESESPEALGLGDPPRGRVQISLTGGRTLELELGHAAPVGWQTYARTPQGELVAVRGQLDRDVLTDPWSFRDASVFDFDASQLAGIALHAPQGTLSVTRDRGDLFWLQGYGRADPGDVENLVLTALDLRLDTFMDNAAPDGITDPDHRLVVTLRDGTMHEARFGPELPMGRLVQTPSGSQGTILADRLAFLGMGPTDLLDPRAFPIRSNRIERIIVAVDDRSAELTGGESGWRAAGLPQEQAAQLYQVLRRTPIDHAATDLPQELPRVTGRVRAWLGSDQVRLVELGPVQGELRLARDASGGPVYAIPEQAVQRIVDLLPQG